MNNTMPYCRDTTNDFAKAERHPSVLDQELMARPSEVMYLLNILLNTSVVARAVQRNNETTKTTKTIVQTLVYSEGSPS